MVLGDVSALAVGHFAVGHLELMRIVCATAHTRTDAHTSAMLRGMAPSASMTRLWPFSIVGEGGMGA